MNTTVKAIFISIGSLFTALFLIFAIGMCTPGFRNMMFRVWNVVPNEQYIEKANSESSLTEELRTCNQELTQLTSEKETLLAQVANLDATNESQAEQIADYEAQIAHLDNQITTLEQRIATISAKVANGTISYVDTRVNIDIPYYDDNGNYMHHIGYSSNGVNDIWYRSGIDLINEYNNNYRNAGQNTLAALQSNYAIRIHTYDEYNVTLDNGQNFMGNVGGTSYRVLSDATVEDKIFIDGQEIDINDFESLIEANRNYTMKFNIEYELDANNRVTNIAYTLNVANQ